MEGRRFIRSISLRNILSFGPDTPELPLEPLNVLIGPNASGKSNLLEALSLLAATPQDIQVPIREGGGVHEWLWKGVENREPATIGFTINQFMVNVPLRYELSFIAVGHYIFVDREDLKTAIPFPGHEEVYPYYTYNLGKAVINARTQAAGPDENQTGQTPSISTASRFERRLQQEQVKHDQSILSQISDFSSYPELSTLSASFAHIRLYREWNLGRLAPIRQPQRADLPRNALMEDASNLGVVLIDLLNRPGIRSKILSGLRYFYPAVEDIRTDSTGGLVRIFLHEAGLHHPVPAERLSDGTLRYLCLLAVLCHPNLPSVVCIEEPELGLHPDMIPQVAKLLIEASARTQLFVTTHSDILVNALSDTPETVIVCEKLDGATQLQRLDAKELKPWLERYRLGDLWIRGDIGGTRW